MTAERAEPQAAAPEAASGLAVGAAYQCGSLSLRQLGVSESLNSNLKPAPEGADLPVLSGSGPADEGVSLNFEGPGSPASASPLSHLGPSLAWGFK